MDLRETFLPPDRRRALVHNETLPDRAIGAVLFADVSGFTRLTEIITNTLGTRRGAEVLTAQLNRVYDALIAEIESLGGSVITFAGDAALCWFAETGERPSAALRAVVCAFALQEAMRQFSAVALPDGTTTTLAIKVTVAYGSVRRFAVGDVSIRRIDVLAGSTVARTAMAENLAHPGEVLVDQAIISALESVPEITEWREDEPSHERFAVLRPLRERVDALIASPNLPLNETLLKPWVHGALYERLGIEGDTFLTELRPVVAMFVRFHGIDLDSDDASDKLDHFIGRVQQILARYDGALLGVDRLETREVIFTRPLACCICTKTTHGARYSRRGTAPLCRELGFIEALQIGISQGVIHMGHIWRRNPEEYQARRETK